MSHTHIEVKKNPNENNASLLRRFSRRMIESGTIPKVKGQRYHERPMSKLSQKNVTLKKLVRRKDIDKLRKLRKIAEKKHR